MIIIDLARGAGDDAAGILGAWRDAAGSGLRAEIEAACADLRAPLLCLADPGTRYEPLSGLGPDRAAGLILAMIDWTGLAAATQSFCADYLRTALAVGAAAGSAGRCAARCWTTWRACCGPGRSGCGQAMAPARWLTRRR